MHTSTYWPSRSHSCQTEAAAALSGLYGGGLRKGRKERATPILLECICTREELIGSHETTKRRPQSAGLGGLCSKETFFFEFA